MGQINQALKILFTFFCTSATSIKIRMVIEETTATRAGQRNIMIEPKIFHNGVIG